MAGRAPRRRAGAWTCASPAEWNGELGRIPGARHLPLGELRARLGELPRDRPIVAVCRSGGRSAEASLILEQAGFPRAANMSGGMIRWHGLGLPTEPRDRARASA